MPSPPCTSWDSAGTVRRHHSWYSPAGKLFFPISAWIIPTSYPSSYSVRQLLTLLLITTACSSSHPWTNRCLPSSSLHFPHAHVYHHQHTVWFAITSCLPAKLSDPGFMNAGGVIPISHWCNSSPWYSTRSLVDTLVCLFVCFWIRIVQLLSYDFIFKVLHSLKICEGHLIFSFFFLVIQHVR